MAWYRTGTVSVTNGSTTVTGAGTSFVSNVANGEGFLGPDGKIYEIAEVVSATQLTLAAAYTGSTAGGQAYAILPTQSALADLAGAAAELVNSFAAVRDGAGQGLFSDGAPASPGIRFANDQDTGLFRPTANNIGVSTGGVDRMRLTATGLGIETIAPYREMELVGTLAVGASAGAGAIGVEIGQVSDGPPAAQVRGFIAVDDGEQGVAVGGDLMIAPRTSVETHIRFFTGTAVSERMRITGTGNVGIGSTSAPNKLTVAGIVSPSVDNTYSFGTASLRISTVYAGTGSINTSDERDKTWRSGLSVAEYQAGLSVLNELGFYQWDDAIAEKGAAGARYHFGVRAQRVWGIFAGEGLVDPIDASGVPGETSYGFLCWDEWEEEVIPVLDDEGRPTGQTELVRVAGHRYGIRPDELALFLIAVQARRQSELEARIAALETAGS